MIRSSSTHWSSLMSSVIALILLRLYIYTLDVLMLCCCWSHDHGLILALTVTEDDPVFVSLID